MKAVRIIPSKLRGKIKIPSSKSLCHRAIISAGLSRGRSIISNVVYSEDITATLRAMSALGVNIKKEENSLIIDGRDFGRVRVREIDCVESGSTLRFLIPVSLLLGKEVTFNGRGGLARRPLTTYYKIFEDKNIFYSGREGLPLTIAGDLKPGDFEIAGNISSQFITGLMFVLPLLKKDSRIILTTELESRGYVDLTIDMLRRFSVKIENRSYKEFYIKGNQQYNPVDYKVEGDFSQAAFFLAAGLLGGEMECEDLAENSLQGDRIIVDIIKEMGGDIEVLDGRILSRASKLGGITIDASQCPDLIPVLSVLASLSLGTTKIINAGRLRIKESDRLAAMATELNKLGADVSETPDGLIINGVENLKGGVVDSWNDHRIAMALSVASIKCTKPLIITNSDAVKKSYPDFFKDFSMLGGDANEWNMGQKC